MKAIHKYNGGNTATLCHKCRVIIHNKLSECLFCDKCTPEISISKNYYPINIEETEKKYNAKYIGDFSLNFGKGWNDKPSSIFYVENPDKSKGHTNYFGLFITYKLDENDKYVPDKMYIQDASSIAKADITGLLVDNKILVSCYTHHFNKYEEDFVDGGMQYTRHTLGKDLVTLKLNKDKFVVYEKRNS